MQTYNKFEAEMYSLTKDEGGRHTPFFTAYRPQFFFGTADITGNVTLPAGVEMVMPGDNTKIIVELINDAVVEKGMRFAIREGGRTVGAGVVTKLISKLGANKLSMDAVGNKAKKAAAAGAEKK